MCTKSFKLVENGIFQEEGMLNQVSCDTYTVLHGYCNSFTVGVTELLNSPRQYPGCSGTRNLHDNISDLRAQVAANQKVT